MGGGGGGGGDLEAAETLQMKANTSTETRTTACTGAKLAPQTRAIAAVLPRHASDVVLPQKLKYTVNPSDHQLPDGLLEAYES